MANETQTTKTRKGETMATKHTPGPPQTLELRIPDGTEHDREIYHPDDFTNVDGKSFPEGHYWWVGFPDYFPACLPDGALHGPFDTESLAIADFQEGRTA